MVEVGHEICVEIGDSAARGRTAAIDARGASFDEVRA